MSQLAATSPRVGILDYGMGNLHSVHRAFLASGADAHIVGSIHEMETMQAMVFPGQGAIVDTMTLLRHAGWDRFIHEWIAADRPFFGICLGLQALFEYSEEGGTAGLGIFPGKVVRFTPGQGFFHKIPHMGWNTVEFLRSDSLLQDMHCTGDSFYFVHSYFLDTEDAALKWGETEHAGVRFTSAIRRGNLVATQFHPEKSQSRGLQLYRNFITTLKDS